MMNFPEKPIKPIHHDLHYHLLPHVQLARELRMGSNNLIQGRLENAKHHAAAIDEQVVNGVNAQLGAAYNVTRSIAKTLHDAINKGLDSSLRKTGTLEHRATSQSLARGHELPPQLIGPDLAAALQIDEPQEQTEVEPASFHVHWVELDIEIQ